MQFTDSSFLLCFLPLALICHRIATRFGAQGEYAWQARLCMFTLTLLFYGWKHTWWLVPFLICIGFDFIWATLLTRTTAPSPRKLFLALSVTQNITLLALFKYWTFLTANVASFSPSLGHAMAQVNTVVPTTLPPGISFYTFESLSFVIDIYRRQIRMPERADEFFAFIGMFPRFVAGPIVRYRDMASQFKNYGGMKITKGLFVFSFGLFLKCCFADNFATFVPAAFEAKGSVHCLTAWLGAVAYAMQIYFDFSGYSLMAIGLGMSLGFRFPPNFNRPYLARDLQDFWKRWHMSLSSWLRDYLYIPMGGNRKGRVRTYINLLLTMVIGGLWHGANWTFIAWGTIHGGWLCFERAFLGSFPAAVKRGMMLFVVLFAWVFFKAGNVHTALELIKSMVTPFHTRGSFNMQVLTSNFAPLAWCLLGIIYCFGVETKLDVNSLESFEIPFEWQWSLGLVLLAMAFPMGSAWVKPIPFLYFQF